MSTNHPTEQPIRLRAFVGRSFLDQDKTIWHDLRDILDGFTQLGFRYEDAKEAQLRPVSEKVRELILQNDIYIGVLTRRYPICSHADNPWGRIVHAFESQSLRKWTTSEWVVEEVGFALGKDRPVILLIEHDVLFPTADLDGDTQWIRFRRQNLAACQTELSQMILGLIAKLVTSIESSTSPAVAAAPEPVDLPASLESEENDKWKLFEEHVSAGRFSEAEEVQKQIIGDLDKEGGVASRDLIDAHFLIHRARKGDSTALETLKERATLEAPNPHDLHALARVYMTYSQYRTAADTLIPHLDRVQQSERTRLASIFTPVKQITRAWATRSSRGGPEG